MSDVQNSFDVPSAHRKVFFTDYGQIPKVERCDMDGQNRTKLVDSKIVFPHGITLDLVSRLIYWADAYLDYIEVVDYEGKGRQTIIQGILVRMGSIWGRTIWSVVALSPLVGRRGIMSTLGKGQDMVSTLMGAVILETLFISLFSFDPHSNPWKMNKQVTQFPSGR